RRSTKAVDVTGPNGNPVRGTTRSGRCGGGGGSGGRGRRGGYGGGGGGCFKCGEIGHMARDCGQGCGGRGGVCLVTTVEALGILQETVQTVIVKSILCSLLSKQLRLFVFC
ncbi:hypothetical protein ERO13_D01G002801v2, partial [Gossypium hirsutum]